MSASVPYPPAELELKLGPVTVASQYPSVQRVMETQRMPYGNATPTVSDEPYDVWVLGAKSPPLSALDCGSDFPHAHRSNPSAAIKVVVYFLAHIVSLFPASYTEKAGVGGRATLSAPQLHYARQHG